MVFLVQFLKHLVVAEKMRPLDSISQHAISDFWVYTLDSTHNLRVGASLAIDLDFSSAFLKKISQLLVIRFLPRHKSIVC